MKKYYTLLIGFLISLNTFSQTVVASRTAPIMPAGYSGTGEAYFEELDNGNFQLRFSEDYSTLRGPDVQLFFANTKDRGSRQQPIGSVLIADLSNVNHFSGARTYPLTGISSVNDFNFLVSYCVANGNLFWFQADFGPINGGGSSKCETSSTATTAWVSSVNICPSDNEADDIPLKTTLDVTIGENYVFLITDENEVVQEVVSTDTYNFEGSGSATQHVYGVHYSGQLNVVLDAHRNQTTADTCHTHSSEDLFLTVTKNGCILPPAECDDNATATTNWISEVSICPSDNEADNISLKTTLNVTFGENYAFLITDENEILQEVVSTDSYNFEGSGNETQRVYGIHYFGQLNANVGANRMETTATECFKHSDSEFFLTITKDGCTVPECIDNLTATTAWVTEVSICPSDGEPDNIPLLTGLDVPKEGGNYAFLITDADEVVQKIIHEDTYDFEGSGSEEQRVYGIHYYGELNEAIGEDRMQTTATICFKHSAITADLFITIEKNDCATGLNDEKFNSQISIYPNPTSDELKIEFPNELAISKVSIFNLQGEQLINTSIDNNNVKLDVSSLKSGSYLMNISNASESITRKLFIQ